MVAEQLKAGAVSYLPAWESPHAGTPHILLTLPERLLGSKALHSCPQFLQCANVICLQAEVAKSLSGSRHPAFFLECLKKKTNKLFFITGMPNALSLSLSFSLFLSLSLSFSLSSLLLSLSLSLSVSLSLSLSLLPLSLSLSLSTVSISLVTL